MAVQPSAAEEHPSRRAIIAFVSVFVAAVAGVASILSVVSSPSKIPLAVGCVAVALAAARFAVVPRRRAVLRDRLFVVAVLSAAALFAGGLAWAAVSSGSADGPVILSLLDDPFAYNDGYSLTASPKQAEEIARDAPTCGSLLRHAEGSDPDAVHISPLFLRVLAEGNTPSGATIVGMRAHVVNSGPSRGGALLECQGGGEISPTGLYFNLDRTDPVAFRLRNGKPAGAYFGRGYFVALAEGETHSFRLTAETTRSYVEWTLEVQIIVNGKVQTRVLDDGGAPFRTTAPRCGENGYGPWYLWPLMRGGKVAFHAHRPWRYC